VWQLAQCKEPVAIIAIDISGSEFNLLRGWDKLQFPVARSDMDAIATLNAVADELKRRRDLYEQFPQARNLARYNRMSGGDLEPWVILLDEGASLLARRETGDILRNAIQTSRQYGIYCLLSSVSVNYKVLETQTRDQFSTRLAFRLPKSSMRIVLDETPPEEPARPGRAWARLAGREMVQIQAPIIGERELVAALESGGPVEQLPEMIEERDPREQQVIDLLNGNEELSDTAIARIVYGHSNGHYVAKVQEIKTRQERRQRQCDNDNAQNE
jgi:DNA segregation ATPase FtsK/SpoIIIE-like protein